MTARTAQDARCAHCNTRFTPTEREPDYCCAGCRVVHDWIGAQGLDRFYDLKGQRVTEAVGNRVFEPADWSWAADLQRQEEASDKVPEASLHLQGMSCVACAWLIEQRFHAQPGAGRLEVFPERGLLHLEWQPGVFSLPAFLADILRFGYQASLPDQPIARRSELSARLGICGGLAMNTMVFTLPHYLGLNPSSDLGTLCNVISLGLACLSVLIGGGYFFKRAWAALRQGILHIDQPISLGLLVATASTLAGWFLANDALFYVDFLAVFTFLMLLGRWVQERALASAQRRLVRTHLLPREASSLTAGAEFSVKPGEIVPVEALLCVSPASFSLEWISGEPDPVPAEPGQIVRAGSRLISNTPRQCQARESYADSIIAGLLKRRTSPQDPLLQNVLRVYLAAVFAVAIAGTCYWLLLGQPITAVQVAVSILVVSCPCALGVSVPFLNTRLSQRLESDGVFLREVSLWSRLSGVQQILFDKTGTLTLPVPRLKNPERLLALAPDAKAALHRLVATNRHPVARALHEALASPASLSGPVEEETGCGVLFTSEADGAVWSLGKPGWKSPSAPHRTALARNGQPLAEFDFEEALRPDAQQDVARLLRRVSRIGILSGDRQQNVHAIAQAVGIPAELAFGDLSPEGKATWLRANGASSTLFIGDGLNDSPALGLARCSAVAATGSALPVEANADFLFLGKGLAVLDRLFEAAAERRRVLGIVFGFAVLYNLGAVAVCWTGHMSPLLAAVLMPSSSLVTLALVAGSRGPRGRNEMTPPSARDGRRQPAPEPVVSEERLLPGKPS